MKIKHKTEAVVSKAAASVLFVHGIGIKCRILKQTVKLTGQMSFFVKNKSSIISKCVIWCLPGRIGIRQDAPQQGELIGCDMDLAGAHSQGIPFPEGLDQAVDGPHTQAEVIAQILTGHAHRYLLPAVDAVFPAIADEKPREFDNAGCNGHLAGGSGRGAQLADQRLDQHLTEPRVNSLPGQEAFHRHSQEQGITLADQVVLNCLSALIAFHFTDEISGTQFGEDKDRAIAPGFTDGVLTFQDNVDSMDRVPFFSEGYPVLSG